MLPVCNMNSTVISSAWTIFWPIGNQWAIAHGGREQPSMYCCSLS